MPPQLLIPYLHPNFYALHNMPREVSPLNTLWFGCSLRIQCGTIADDGVIMPTAMSLSSEKLERHGLYLIEDSQNIFLWIGRDAVPGLYQDVFDVSGSNELRGGKVCHISAPVSSAKMACLDDAANA